MSCKRKLKLICIRLVLLVLLAVGLVLLGIWLVLGVLLVLLAVGLILLGVGVLGLRCLRWSLLSLFFLLFLMLGLRLFYLNGFVIDFHLGVGLLCKLLFSSFSGQHSGSSLRSSPGLFCFHFWSFIYIMDGGLFINLKVFSNSTYQKKCAKVTWRINKNRNI